MSNYPRGIRNNNPGNIRWGEKWQGLTDSPENVTYPVEISAGKLFVRDSQFCMFKTIEFGYRALIKLLWTYERKYGLRTVKKIIQRYAPPNENDTKVYVETVAKQLNVGIDEEINLHDKATMIVLLKAITRHENGMQPYSDNTLSKAWSAANAS